MPSESASIQAIQLVRTVFENVHGNLGVLKFNIEELTPINGADEKDSKKWKVICSFFESVGSSSPSRFESIANLNDNTVTIKKLGTETPVTKYTVTKQDNPAS
ncbi:hypothetical protein AUJ30_01700 [Candidatus Wolfebacteria bacterium CG1_02_39_135]|uniref:Uncharacterized protein n=2 Tax=Parcubacteria group TaxID=1794811 RepID=A0A2M7Z3V0_9BACT|nr:MAG: hypothetical protein AUJ30_01700 [Candidatus Wolfebacteria bacterium CG1_02_39_135]PJA83795.1 MAG: hypothetical protein CO146_00540 [Candidatus Nealsonbacteria bacterium CG_4_9_14_3_um_filter_37_29]